MTATAIREGARVLALIVILVIAAVLGLVVGNALNGRSSSDVGAQAPDTTTLDGTPSYADPHYQIIRRAAATLDGTPSYADPHYQIIRGASAADAADASTLSGPTPR
jgi:hypothetical protein